MFLQWLFISFTNWNNDTTKQNPRSIRIVYSITLIQTILKHPKSEHFLLIDIVIDSQLDCYWPRCGCLYWPWCGRSLVGWRGGGWPGERLGARPDLVWFPPISPGLGRQESQRPSRTWLVFHPFPSSSGGVLGTTPDLAGFKMQHT